MRTSAGDDDADLVRRAAMGDGEAFARLFERWFDRVFDVAWHIVRNRDTAAEVAQETFATAWQQLASLHRPESFGGWLLRISRNKGLNRLAREQRSRPVGDEETLAMHDLDQRSADDPADPVVDRARDDLVWAASAALGDDDASILSLHLRHGLGAGELADELGIAPNAAHQRLFRLKKRLGDAIGAWTLWRLGHPSCPDLRTLLANVGTTRFDRDASAMITAHVRGCPDCESRRTLQLSPEALFAAVPIVAAGPVLRAQAAGALEATGVPATTTAPPQSQSSPGEAGPRRAPRLGVRASVVVGGAVVLLVVAAVAVLAERTGDGTPGDSAALVDAVEEPTPTDRVTTEPPPASVAPTVDGSVAEQPTTAAGGGAPATPPPEAPASTTTTAPPAVAPPVIGGFRATSAGASGCDAGQTSTAFVWSSTGGTSALLGPSRGVATPVEPSGSLTTCATSASAWVLTVSGPGGTATAGATVP